MYVWSKMIEMSEANAKRMQMKDDHWELIEKFLPALQAFQVSYNSFVVMVRGVKYPYFAVPNKVHDRTKATTKVGLCKDTLFTSRLVVFNETFAKMGKERRSL